MRIEKDFEEFVELLNAHGVRYMIVGAFAMAVHTRPRATGDIDFFVGHDRENAERLLSALSDFGFGSAGIDMDDLMHPERVIQLGFDPVRIDLLTSISGVNFDDAYPRAIKAAYGRHTALFISREDLIANKQATGRPQDLADLVRLLRAAE